ncbi:CLUMA_CG010735, isoform A [Clunio marinus]|uniref:CLUMA_CG010735, isoform A n=1 Tax=Clunio marinus TaxID=568069 RepID=A0A1J1IAS1_9DIPT|nr:CLUMA_CG010735, isoform A [Clunio marinus]
MSKLGKWAVRDVLSFGALQLDGAQHCMITTHFQKWFSSDETGAKVIIMFHTCTKHKQETENSPSTSSSLRSIFILSSFIDDRQ